MGRIAGKPNSVHFNRRVTADGAIERRCKMCGEWKPVEQMVKAHRCLDGRAPRCKPCDSLRRDLHHVGSRPTYLVVDPVRFPRRKAS